MSRADLRLLYDGKAVEARVRPKKLRARAATGEIHVARNAHQETARQEALALRAQVRSLIAAVQAVPTLLGGPLTHRAVRSALMVADTAAGLLEGYLTYGDLWPTSREKIRSAARILNGGSQASDAGSRYEHALDYASGIWLRPTASVQDRVSYVREAFAGDFGDAFRSIDAQALTAQVERLLFAERAGDFGKHRDVHEWRSLEAVSVVASVAWPVLEQARLVSRLDDLTYIRFPTGAKTKNALHKLLLNARSARMKRAAGHPPFD